MLENTRDPKSDAPREESKAAGLDRPEQVSFDRRTADLGMLGLSADDAAITAKIESEVLSKMAKSYASWLEANENPITDIFDERWPENLAARVATPGVIAMIELSGLDDHVAREKLEAAISDDPGSRLYGGMHGSFVARISPEGIAAIARLEEVVRIS